MPALKGPLAALAAACALAFPARAEPPAWLVRDKDSEMLIFGSVHVLPPDLAWRTPRLEAALKAADDLWFEIPADAATEAEIQRLVGRVGVLPAGQSLSRLLPARDAERLARVAQNYAVDRAALEHLEPWLAEVVLAGAAYRKAGAASAYGVEAVIEAAAPAALRRAALETPAEQIALFDETPMGEQLASFSENLRELEEEPEAYAELLKAWTAGDVAAIHREVLEPMRRATPRLFRRMVTDRNARWARALDRRLKGRGRTVVVVGVGHLIGPGSLPERLRALGYSVERP